MNVPPGTMVGVELWHEADTPSDTELAVLVASGELTALGDVFDRHARAVSRFAYRRCGDRAATEDATSATFIEFWRSRERALVSDGSLLPWLLGIANNVLRSAERSVRRRERAVSRLPLANHVPDHADAVVDLAHAHAQAVRLRAALVQLTPEERDVISLSLYGELSMRQIAETLGIPEGTVKSRLSRARARVAAAFTAHETGVTA